MDWELYERYRATLVFLGIIVLSVFLLLFQHTFPVQHLRSLLISCTLPPERLLTQLTTPAGSENMQTAGISENVSGGNAPVPEYEKGPVPEQIRKLHMLQAENKRLNDLLGLQQRLWPSAVAAHVVGRDPQRWFEDIILDKGSLQGIAIDNPVIVVSHGVEALVGRVVDVGPHIAKVMLIQDSLSAVAATIEGQSGEDGIVEGSNSHDLFLRYLSRNNTIKIGDRVVTSGLGQIFPEGIPIGSIQEINPDPRQLFLQARLRAAANANDLRIVLILIQSGRAQ